MTEKSIIYAIPWIILVLVYLYLSLREQLDAENLNYGIIAATVFLLFFGLRGFVGWDYANYYPSYVYDTHGLFDVGSLADKMSALEWDKGYSLYMIVCKTFIPNYHAFIFFSTLIDVVLLFYFFKKYSFNISLSFLIFIVFSVTLEIDTLRNMKALVICLAAIPYIIERKPLKFFILIAIAATFHFTALLLAPAYFFIHKKIPQWLLWGLFIVGNLWYFLLSFNVFDSISPYLSYLPAIFSEKGEMYIDSGSFGVGYVLSFGFIERTISWLLIIFSYDKIVKKQVWMAVFLNFTICYLMCFFLFGSILVLLTRITLFLSFGYWIIFPAIINLFQSEDKKIFYYGIFLYLSAYSLMQAGGKTSIMNKYETIIFNNTTYEYKMEETSNERINEQSKLIDELGK